MITARRWKEILAVTVLTAALAFVFGILYNKASFNNTIFINLGAKQASGIDRTASPYETVQAADQFSESVQGWFKNPALIAQIRTRAQYEVDFSVRKQEKQNLVITYKTPTAEEGEKVAQVTEEFIRNEVGVFNRETGSDFRIPIFDLFTKEGTIHPGVFAVMGLLLGLMLGYALGALIERFLRELHQFRHGKS